MRCQHFHLVYSFSMDSIISAMVTLFCRVESLATTLLLLDWQKTQEEQNRCSFPSCQYSSVVTFSQLSIPKFISKQTKNSSNLPRPLPAKLLNQKLYFLLPKQNHLKRASKSNRETAIANIRSSWQLMSLYTLRKNLPANDKKHVPSTSQQVLSLLLVSLTAKFMKYISEQTLNRSE